MGNGAVWNPNKVVAGTFGKVWLAGQYVFESKGLQASVEIQMEAVPQAGQLADGYKMVGYSGSGTMRMHKVTSRGIRLISSSLKQGIPEFEIISELADPAADGAERILLKGVQFTTLPLIDWENKTLGETEMPFTFRDWDPIDLIKE